MSSGKPGVWIENGAPVYWAPGEAWAFEDGKWRRVHSTDVGLASKELSPEAFKSRFGDLPPLPATAFRCPK